MKTRDVAVFGKQDVAALATDVNAVLGHRVGVARRVTSGEKRDATDVALRRAPEPLDAIGARRLLRENLEPDDLLADAEHIARCELERRLGSHLQVDAVERELVLDEQLGAAHRERRVPRREVAVAREDPADVTPDGHHRTGQGKGTCFGTVGAQRREHDLRHATCG